MKEKKITWLLLGSFLVFLIIYNGVTFAYAENQDRKRDQGFTLIHSLGRELIRIDSTINQMIVAEEVTGEAATELAWSSEQLGSLNRLMTFYLEEVNERPSNNYPSNVTHLSGFFYTLASRASTSPLKLDTSQLDSLEVLRKEVYAFQKDIEFAKSLEAEFDDNFHPKQPILTYFETLDTYSHWRYLNGNTISHLLVEN